MKLGTHFQEADQLWNERQFQQSHFFLWLEKWQNGKISLNQVAILKTNFPFWYQDQRVVTYDQTNVWVTLNIVWIGSSLVKFPVLVNPGANSMRRKFIIIAHWFRWTLTQEIMQQDQQFHINQTFGLVILSVLVKDLIHFLYLVPFLPTFLENWAVIFKLRRKLVILDKAGNPSLRLSSHLIVDEFYLVE